MNFDEIAQRESALIRDYCISCNQPLKPDSAFCEHCGPPVVPGEEQESATSLGSALVKIGVMTLVFAVLVLYKLDWNYETLFQGNPQVTQELPPAEIPQDEDFHLFHFVKVKHANIREKPEKDAKIIAGAGKGERLRVLEVGEDWTQVEVGGQKGYIATRLLSATIE